jgi:hypothetical protein
MSVEEEMPACSGSRALPAMLVEEGQGRYLPYLTKRRPVSCLAELVQIGSGVKLGPGKPG